MAPHQHLGWFEDNVAWFEDLPLDRLNSAVPNCPGWTVEDVLNHLSFGLGLGYPVALSKGPETPASEAFTGLAVPNANPTGPAAQAMFSVNMRGCLDIFSATDPDTPCWTYAGPGTARFWFRRAAIETALHRMDIEEALPELLSPLPVDRMIDAIAETLDFALPLAAQLTDEPGGRLTVSSPELDITLNVGTGAGHATIVGPGRDVLGALWGRDRSGVNVTGDQNVASGWLSRIEAAFAGR